MAVGWGSAHQKFGGWFGTAWYVGSCGKFEHHTPCRTAMKGIVSEKEGSGERQDERQRLTMCGHHVPFLSYTNGGCGGANQSGGERPQWGPIGPQQAAWKSTTEGGEERGESGFGVEEGGHLQREDDVCIVGDGLKGDVQRA